jgi:hypothetical protein
VKIDSKNSDRLRRAADALKKAKANLKKAQEKRSVGPGYDFGGAQLKRAEGVYLRAAERLASARKAVARG